MMDAEKSVLGRIIEDNTVLSRGLGLSPEDFDNKDYRIIYRAMLAISSTDKEIDVITLNEEITKQGKAVEAMVLNDLVNSEGTVANVEAYAQIVRDQASKRRIISIANQVASDGISTRDAQGFLQDTSNTLSAAIQDIGINTGPSVEPTAVENVATELLDTWDNPQLSLSTGFQQLDDILEGGIRAGDIVGLTGAAGAGKSVWLGQAAYELAKNGACVIYFSIEMQPKQVVARWIARNTWIAGKKLYDRPDVNFNSVYRGTKDDKHKELIQSGYSMLLDDTHGRLFIQWPPANVTPVFIKTVVDRARAKHPDALPVVVIDPLQRLYTAPTLTRNEKETEYINRDETSRVGAVSSELKRLADKEDWAMLIASDTTKTGAAGADSSQAMRGSYMVNHNFTILAGIRTVKREKENELSQYKYGSKPPIVNQTRRDFIRDRLPQKYYSSVSIVELSKARDYDKKDMVFGFTGAAMCFNEKGSTAADVSDENSIPYNGRLSK